MAKSFHLRTLYQAHGLTDQQRTYHFFHNLYDYEQRPVKLVGQSKIDQLTEQKLNSQQTIFRRYDYETHQTSYYYLTKLILPKVNNLHELDCSDNLLTELDFLSSLNKNQIIYLNLSDNNFFEQDLSCLTDFTKLK